MSPPLFDVEVVADDGIAYCVTIRVTRCVPQRGFWNVADYRILSCTVADETADVDVNDVPGLNRAINEAVAEIKGWDTGEHR